MPETEQPSLEEKIKGTQIREQTNEDLKEMGLLEEEQESDEAPEKLSTGDADDLFEEKEHTETSSQLTPERVAQAWDKLNSHEQKFILAANDETFSGIIGKFKERSEKAKQMWALRKLIQTNDPRASKIER
ncbi:MAG: hypothetical protein Q8P78_01320 [bacterium]|nr:hypothetical protein [bacterium]